MNSRSSKPTIECLVDNPASWIYSYAQEFTQDLIKRGYPAALITRHDQITTGDILILFCCEKILNQERLDLHSFNLVVHASALPKGRGFASSTCQILEEKDSIPLTLFEAALKVDSGPVYDQLEIQLEGHELVNERRQKLAAGMMELINCFLAAYPNVAAVPQTDEPTYYPRRRPADSQLNIDQPIETQIRLLRVSDNERYP